MSDAPKGLMDVDGRSKETIVLGEDEPSARMQLHMLVKIGPALVTVVLCIAASFLVPALQFARPWKPGDPVPFWNLLGRPFEAEALEEEAARVAKVDELAKEVLGAGEDEPVRVEREPRKTKPPQPGEEYEPEPDDLKEPVQSLELVDGSELDRFFAELKRSDEGEEGAITRVVHWGDSAIGLDGIPGAIRVRLQNRFGDSGHGWHNIAPPNTSYLHRDVRFRHNKEWETCFIIMRCKKDGHYGLGGATVRSSGGAKSSFAPHPKRGSGTVSRFGFFYADTPGGGRFRTRVDDGEYEIINTRSDKLEDKVKVWELQEGSHELAIEAIGYGRVRAYGVVLERDRPGVVWDSMAMVGAFTNRLSAFDEEHLGKQLEFRQTNLAVFTYGGNDMIRTSMKMEDYTEEYRRVIQKVKAAKPDIDCLIMAPLDHGERKGVRIVSRDIVAPMVEAQRQAAKAEGCAFFDTWTAMGGDGSAGRWFRADPRLMGGDLGHATHKGHQLIGEMFYRALIEAYVAYRRRLTASATGAP